MCFQYLPWIGPAWLRHLIAKLIPDANFKHVKSIVDTLYTRSRDIYLDKKEALLKGDEELKHQVGQGKDIMSVLRESKPVLDSRSALIDTVVKMNLEAPEDERLSEDEVIAQMS